MYERSTQLISRPSYASGKRRLQSLSGLQSVTSNIFNVFAERERQKGELEALQTQQAMPQGGGMPGWLIPALAVGGIGLFLYLRKK